MILKKLLILLILLAAGLQTTLAQSNEAIPVNNTSKENTQKIKVFPNPATNVVNILGLQNSSRADIIVSDTYGNAVLKHQWPIKNMALNIPISNLETGIYMISIRSENQHVKTKFYKK